MSTNQTHLLFACDVAGALLAIYLAGVTGALRGALRNNVTGGVAMAAIAAGIVLAMVIAATLGGIIYLLSGVYAPSVTIMLVVACWAISVGCSYYEAKREKPSNDEEYTPAESADNGTAEL